MQTERFHQFVQMIEGIHKSVSKIRMIYAPCLGVKSVHLFWLYELLSHPDGLTASSLAATGKIDRSLVSREIEELCVGGYVEVIGGGGKRRNYNSRIVLTEKGRGLAQTISALGLEIQSEANLDLDEEELAAFYVTLGKLERNLSAVAERKTTDPTH
jgi:DNA-binding MarR family transcriptional regulator